MANIYTESQTAPRRCNTKLHREQYYFTLSIPIYFTYIFVSLKQYFIKSKFYCFVSSSHIIVNENKYII